MSLRQMCSLVLGLGALPAASAFVERPVPDLRCSPIGGIPGNGYDPVPLVASAQVILRARADSVAPMPSRLRRGRLGPETFVHFTVLEVIDSGGMPIPPALRYPGYLSDKPDFNTKPFPYRWARSDGLRGSCLAFTHQRGGEFLLLLQGSSVESLDPYWSGLTPTNEQVSGADDPWVTWVRDARRAGPHPRRPYNF